jgi:hypothetical protein
MEVLGKLTKAGLEGDAKKYFFATVVPSTGKEWHVGVPDEAVRKAATALVGKLVKATMTKGEKYWGMTGVESAGSNGGGTAKEDVDWDRIGRQKARCSIITSVCTLFSNAKALPTPDEMVDTCRVFENYVYEPTLLDIAKELGGEVVED